MNQKTDLDDLVRAVAYGDATTAKPNDSRPEEAEPTTTGIPETLIKPNETSRRFGWTISRVALGGIAGAGIGWLLSKTGVAKYDDCTIATCAAAGLATGLMDSVYSEGEEKTPANRALSR